MKINSVIQKEQQDVNDVRSMVEVYQEIAAMRMQSVKDAILDARQYYESLAVLVREVRPWLKVQSNPAETVSKQKKTALFFSANTGLYGDIIEKTFRSFMEYLQKEDADAAVVGAAGKRMYESAKLKNNVSFFACDDAHPSKEQVIAIVQYAQQYDHAEVFHGRFINLVSQVPFKSSLSNDSVVENALGKDWEKTSNYYLFEPTPKDITHVVEGEIFASVVEQILHESNFSKFAARMMHLDDAIQNIDQRLLHIEHTQRRAMRRIENKKQLSRLTGRMLWQK